MMKRKEGMKKVKEKWYKSDDVEMMKKTRIIKDVRNGSTQVVFYYVHVKLSRQLRKCLVCYNYTSLSASTYIYGLNLYSFSNVSLSLSLYIYIHTYIHIYIYIEMLKRIQVSFNNLIPFLWAFLKWKKGNIISTPYLMRLYISKLYYIQTNTSIMIIIKTLKF